MADRRGGRGRKADEAAGVEGPASAEDVEIYMSKVSFALLVLGRGAKLYRAMRSAWIPGVS